MRVPFFSAFTTNLTRWTRKWPISPSPHLILSTFVSCKDIFCAFPPTDVHTKGDHSGTHSLVLSQLMKWLVRCPMCRTYGSLPIRWITLNRWAHSSADMIVLMDGNNIQTAVETRQLRVESCIFLSWRGEVCLFLSRCFYFHSRPCVFVFSACL